MSMNPSNPFEQETHTVLQDVGTGTLSDLDEDPGALTYQATTALIRENRTCREPTTEVVQMPTSMMT
jgi:hypothetical protein